MMQLVVLFAIAALLHGAKGFVPPGQLQEPTFSAALAFGFVLLAALFSGRLITKLQTPRLTGYLIAGAVAGPYGLGLLTEPMVHALGLVDGTAVCLIALTAGGELNFERIRPLLAVVRSMTLWAVVGTAIGLSVAVLALRPLLLWLAALSWPGAIAISVVLGITLASQSPAVVIAMLEESRADGPVSRTMLALVVISDLLVIVLFTLASSASHVVLGGSVDTASIALDITWELFGSMVIGLVVGMLISAYIARVRTGHSLFVLIVCIVVAEVGHRVHLDPLLVMLAAGVFLENFTKRRAAQLIHDIEEASLPVYVLFFAVAGAVLRLDLLPAVAVPAGVLCAVRAGGFWLGARKAARVTAAPDGVARYTWVGLVPQAGLALALALILRRSFPDFGTDAAVLVLSIVGINQLIGPVLLRMALARAGEAGRKGEGEAQHSATVPEEAATAAPAQ